MIHNLAHENPKISDAKIAINLRDYGVSISRRTVNKYRNLEIPNQT
jgi:DNA-directed RNA polymerase specialized sigma54-like protein